MSKHGTIHSGSSRVGREGDVLVESVTEQNLFGSACLVKAIRAVKESDNSELRGLVQQCYEKMTGTRQVIIDKQLVSVGIPSAVDLLGSRKYSDFLSGVGVFTPSHSEMHVAHLDDRMCEMLAENSRVYESVTNVGFAHSWDVKRSHSGDNVGFATSGVLRDRGFSDQDVDRGISVSFSGISGVGYGERIMLICPTRRLAYGEPAEVEISFGGLRLTSHLGYNYFGLSVPVRHVGSVVFHIKGTAALYFRFQTGRVGKGFGSLERHKSVRFRHPSVAFSHEIGGDVDPVLTPNGIPTYDVQWVGNTQTMLQMFGVQFFHVGNVTVLLTTPMNFNVLVPTRRAGSLSRLAVLNYRYTPLQESTAALADVVATRRPAANTSLGSAFTLAEVFGHFGVELFHNPSHLQVITYDRGLPVSYAFSRGDFYAVPDSIVRTSIANYGTSGKLVGATVL